MIFQRYLNTLKTHGVIGLVRHFFRHKLPIHYCLIFQKAERSDSCCVFGLIVERYRTRGDVDPMLLETLAQVKDGRMMHQFDTLFSKGCELWLGCVNGAIVGICWSQSHVRKSDYFVPLKETDANILSCFVFPESRGKGVYPAMLETMVSTLFVNDNIRSVYIDCKSWNTASVRGIQKAGFVLVGKAIRIVLFNKDWILWNQCRESTQINKRHDEK